MQPAASISSLLLLLFLLLHTFSAHISPSTALLFLLLASALSLSHSLFPLSVSFCIYQSHRLRCWIINHNPRLLLSHQVEEYRRQEKEMRTRWRMGWRASWAVKIFAEQRHTTVFNSYLVIILSKRRNSFVISVTFISNNYFLLTQMNEEMGGEHK